MLVSISILTRYIHYKLMSSAEADRIIGVGRGGGGGRGGGQAPPII